MVTFQCYLFSKSSKKMSMKTAINICRKYREVRRFQLELQAFWAGRKPIYFVDCLYRQFPVLLKDH